MTAHTTWDVELRVPADADLDAVRFVSGTDREIDPYHDAYPLADDAAALFDDLATSGGRTHVPTGSG